MLFFWRSKRIYWGGYGLTILRKFESLKFCCSVGLSGKIVVDAVWLMLVNRPVKNVVQSCALWQRSGRLVGHRNTEFHTSVPDRIEFVPLDSDESPSNNKLMKIFNLIIITRSDNWLKVFRKRILLWPGTSRISAFFVVTPFSHNNKYKNAYN